MSILSISKIVTVMLLWAACYPLLTIGIQLAPHLSFATLRALIAGLVLVGLACALRRPFPRKVSVWATLSVMGFGATSLGFLGMFHAAEFVSPGIATVIANTQPLLAAGADVMARDAVGNTPLHKAAHYGYAEKIQALLTADADVMARDVSGSTPLHWAALHDAPASIQALLAAGADAKAKDKDGETPWALAQENEKLKGTKAYWALNDAQYN